MKLNNFKKIFAVALVITMISSLVTVAAATDSNDVNDDVIEYTKYSLETGEKTKYSINAATISQSIVPFFGAGSTPVMPRTIFDAEWEKKSTGVSAFPYRAIASLDLYWYNSAGKQIDYQAGTGFAIGSGKVLTAAHCLYNLGNKQPSLRGVAPDKIVLKFGRSDGTVYKQATATEYYVNSEWDSVQDANYDYGVIIVPTSVTTSTGYFGTRTTADTTTKYTLSGYPYDNVSYFGKYLYTATKAITQVNSTTLSHKLNAVGGVSGAPLYT